MVSRGCGQGVEDSLSPQVNLSAVLVQLVALARLPKRPVTCFTKGNGMFAALKSSTGFSELLGLQRLALAGGPATLDACLAKDTQVRQWGLSDSSVNSFKGSSRLKLPPRLGLNFAGETVSSIRVNCSPPRKWMIYDVLISFNHIPIYFHTRHKQFCGSTESTGTIWHPKFDSPWLCSEVLSR